jgi:hypothetical protein
LARKKEFPFDVVYPANESYLPVSWLGKDSDNKKDKNQGNFQITFGISCGQNVSAAKTDEGIFKVAGCTQPRLTKDSDDPVVLTAFDIGWQVGKKMGIDYCQDDFLAVNAWAQPTFDLVKYLRGGPVLLLCHSFF